MKPVMDTGMLFISHEVLELLRCFERRAARRAKAKYNSLLFVDQHTRSVIFEPVHNDDTTKISVWCGSIVQYVHVIANSPITMARYHPLCSFFVCNEIERHKTCYIIAYQIVCSRAELLDERGCGGWRGVYSMTKNLSTQLPQTNGAFRRKHTRMSA